MGRRAMGSRVILKQAGAALFLAVQPRGVLASDARKPVPEMGFALKRLKLARGGQHHPLRQVLRLDLVAAAQDHGKAKHASPIAVVQFAKCGLIPTRNLERQLPRPGVSLFVGPNRSPGSTDEQADAWARQLT